MSDNKNSQKQAHRPKVRKVPIGQAPQPKEDIFAKNFYINIKEQKEEQKVPDLNPQEPSEEYAQEQSFKKIKELVEGYAKNKTQTQAYSGEDLITKNLEENQNQIKGVKDTLNEFIKKTKSIEQSIEEKATIDDLVGQAEIMNKGVATIAALIDTDERLSASRYKTYDNAMSDLSGYILEVEEKDEDGKVTGTKEVTAPVEILSTLKDHYTDGNETITRVGTVLKNDYTDVLEKMIAYADENENVVKMKVFGVDPEVREKNGQKQTVLWITNSNFMAYTPEFDLPRANISVYRKKEKKGE